MYLRRPVAALAAVFTLLPAVPVLAQTTGAALVEPRDRPEFIATARTRPPEFRMPEGDHRMMGEPQRNGLIASVPINRNFLIGVGRFRVGEIHGPRTYTESDRNPGSMAPRQRSIAGAGFSLRFGN